LLKTVYDPVYVVFDNGFAGKQSLDVLTAEIKKGFAEVNFQLSDPHLLEQCLFSLEHDVLFTVISY